MSWVWSNAGEIWALTVEHILLAVPPIILGFLISIPLGYWASRSRIARSVLLTAGNILYTVPALALVVLVPVILNLPILASQNVVFALTIYAVAIMVRSAADAFTAVPDSVRQSAEALGYAPVQRFFRVELPLAGPVLLAGVRVVSVSTLSLVTIGALVGIDSLGNFFTDGFQRQFLTEIVVGIVLVLVLAAVFDVVISLIGRVLLPWNRSTDRLRNRAVQGSHPIPTAGGAA